MALINNIYVHVTSGGESWDKSVDSTSHPVEKGLETTDTIRRKATTLSLSGEIVDYGNVKAMSAVSKIEELKNKGSLITYIGRRAAKNLQIQSFKYDFSNEVWGGCSFSMELKEVRIAKKAYTPTKASTTKPSKTITPKVGDIVVFKGGNVYVSSDAKKAATTKGRQSCKVTNINTRSWSLHDYHLISTEKKYPYNVYGWVDAKDIEGVTSAATPTNSVTNGGTQQTDTKSESKKFTLTEVTYTVKSGDTLYQITDRFTKMGLVDDTGKDISMAWIKNKNRNAFLKSSRNGESLRKGYKMLVGYRKRGG